MQIVQVDSVDKGIEKTKEVLYEMVDNKTVLFLSGGKTPEVLYKQLAQEKVIKPAAIALVDERFGEPMHENSNELMIANTGLLDYCEKYHIPVHLILQKGKSQEEVAKAYDETVRTLFFHFPKSVGIMGIGKDGHTSSIAPNRDDFTNPMFGDNKHEFVDYLDDPHGPYGKRIGLTFPGLMLLDDYLILCFGAEKAEPLRLMLTKGPLEELPARFYNISENTKKSLLITDQTL